MGFKETQAEFDNANSKSKQVRDAIATQVGEKLSSGFLKTVNNLERPLEVVKNPVELVFFSSDADGISTGQMLTYPTLYDFRDDIGKRKDTFHQKIGELVCSSSGVGVLCIDRNGSCWLEKEESDGTHLQVRLHKKNWPEVNFKKPQTVGVYHHGGKPYTHKETSSSLGIYRSDHGVLCSFGRLAELYKAAFRNTKESEITVFKVEVPKKGTHLISFSEGFISEQELSGVPKPNETKRFSEYAKFIKMFAGVQISAKGIMGQQTTEIHTVEGSSIALINVTK